MKLQEVFSSLAYGELSQLVLGQHTEGEVNESQYPALVSHINLGLTALYTRFNLKEREMRFPLQADVTTYQLKLDDILKVESVHTESNEALALNDSTDQYSCFTPSLNVLVVPLDIVNKVDSLPDELKSDYLYVHYRANHPRLVTVGGYINPLTTEVELPYSHLQALLYFVASRANNPIGMSNEFHAGNSWAAKYEMECARLEGESIEVDAVVANERFSARGWV